VHLACYRRNQAILLEAPPSIPESFSPEPEVAERVIDAALAEGREELTAPEVAALLAAYDLGIVATAPGAQQATVRVTEDPLFGPVIRLDLEGRGEQAVGLPPLNLALAYELLREAAPASPKDELALTLVKVSQMVCDLDRVVGLELDLALAVDTVFVRSARARISSRRTGVARLAIRPYPKELEQPLVLRDGKELLLRAIRPEDALAFRHMVEDRTGQEDRRLRSFSAIKTLTPQLCARLTQIDYDREMALVAIDPGAGLRDAFCGVVRIAADPDHERAEYAVLVRSDLKGQGLGRQLMQAMIGYARAQGLSEIFGEVLRENTPMLQLAEALGFERDAVPDAPELVMLRLRL